MSQLSQIQQEILRRFQRPRQSADDQPLSERLPDGRSVDEAVQGQSPDRMSGVRSSSVFAPPPQQPSLQAPQPAPTGQVLTPTNQANITRPRSVFAPPPYTNSEGVTDFRVPKKAGEELPPVSMSRDRRAEPRDYVADDSQYLRDLESKKPKWTDKAVDVLRGVNSAVGSSPNVFTPTKSEREELKARGMLGRDIAIQKEQTAQEMAQMVPVDIPDGQGGVIHTSVPRGKVGSTLEANARTNQAQTRQDQTAQNNRRSRLISQHNGLKEFDPDDPKNAGFVAAWTKEFGYAPAKKTSGSLLQYRQGYDANGNLVAEILDKGTGQTTQAQGSNITQTEQGATREQRAAQFKAAEAGRDKRAQARNAQSEKNATIMAGGVVSRMGDPEVHKNNISEIDKDMGDVDTEIAVITAHTPKGFVMPAVDATALNQLRQRKNALERERRDEREKLGKIESAQGNLKTRGRGTSTSQDGGAGGGSFNLGAWKTDHPNATPEQVRAMRAKAKIRKMSIVE